MDLQTNITRNGVRVVSSRQLLGEWDDTEDRETMIGKGEGRHQCECHKACHGDLEI